ncbi:hypothetical protein ACE6H2_011335 [Prunus campanulata]
MDLQFVCQSALAYLCLLSLSWFKKKPLLFFSGFSRKKIKGASLDHYKEHQAKFNI